MANAFLTPNHDILTGVMIRRFFLVDAGLLPYLTGAVEELTADYNWEKFGTMTPAELVEIFEEAIANMDNCV